jgi:DNA-binding GntR family transcriptional regulator
MLKKENSQQTLPPKKTTEKIHYRPVWEQAYDVLRAQILDGRLVSGTSLNLRELAAQLEISVTPVRDALLRLTAEGLVEGSESRGLRVTLLTETDIAQTLDLRIVLEVYALEQSGPRLNKQDLRSLRNLIEDEADLMQEHDEQIGQRYTEVGRAFHHALVAAAANGPLLDLYERLHTFVVMERAQHGFRPDRIEQDHCEHIDLVAALQRHAYPEAIQLLKEHLERIRDYTLEVYHAQTSSEKTEE